MAFFILGAGAISLATLHRTAERLERTRPLREAEWRTVTNQVAELTGVITALRNDIKAKKNQLRQMQTDGAVDDKLLRLLEGKELDSDARVELRYELGIGWNSSDEYVLVTKRVLKEINLDALNYSLQPTDAACAVLAVTPEECAELNEASKRITAERDGWIRSHAQRTEPAGEIVAQYTIPAARSVQQGISNRVFTAFMTTLGLERAELLLNYTRPELGRMLDLPREEAITMTVRRFVAGGEPELECETKHGLSPPHVIKVRYGYYPSLWFLRLFPGGWPEFAKREGFELPKEFREQ